MSDDFELRQILVTHESVWRALVSLGIQHGLDLVRLPDGADDDGRPFFQESRPEAPTCPDCGPPVPTYGYMPKAP